MSHYKVSGDLAKRVAERRNFAMSKANREARRELAQAESRIAKRQAQTTNNAIEALKVIEKSVPWPALSSYEQGGNYTTIFEISDGVRVGITAQDWEWDIPEREDLY